MVVGLAIGHPVTAAAQTRPDFSGIWLASAADDMANSPCYKCRPYGPTRGLQSTNPFQIIQTEGLFAIITEHIDYRLVYTDGRRHPEDILDYPEWMGHSIGRWDGDTLAIDTIGMREETWLDTAGFEHSDKLHLTERLQKVGPDNIRITVTVEDPVFFTKPFTYARVARRLGKGVRPRPSTPGLSVRGRGPAEPAPPVGQGDDSAVRLRGAVQAGDESVTVTMSPTLRSVSSTRPGTTDWVWTLRSPSS
jgi:hypothetical protein